MRLSISRMVVLTADPMTANSTKPATVANPTSAAIGYPIALMRFPCATAEIICGSVITYEVIRPPFPTMVSSA